MHQTHRTHVTTPEAERVGILTDLAPIFAANRAAPSTAMTASSAQVVAIR
jgi:hypothetical protein